jgi:hypothetical protein
MATAAPGLGMAAIPALEAFAPAAAASLAPEFASLAMTIPEFAPMFASTAGLAPALDSMAGLTGTIANVAENGMGLGNSLAQMLIPASPAPMSLASAGAAAPAATAAAPEQGVGGYMSKLADSLIAGAPQMAMNGAVLLYQQNAAEEAQRRADEAEAEAMAKIMAEGEKTNAAVQDWAGNYLSADAMAKNTADAESTSLAKIMDKLAGGSAGIVAPIGNLSSDYTDALAAETARVAQAGADNARRIAALNAPGNMIQNMNFAGLIPARQADDSARAARAAGASAQSKMRSIRLG